jgi:hypothetical protein
MVIAMPPHKQSVWSSGWLNWSLLRQKYNIHVKHPLRQKIIVFQLVVPLRTYLTTRPTAHRDNCGKAVASNYLQRMPLWISLMIFAAAVTCLVATTIARSQAGPSEDFESCKAIKADQARLDCFKNLLSNSESGNPAVGEPSKDPWPLIKTPRPGGGADAIAVMRTADTSQSDPDLAGLMIRCGERPGLEIVLALIRPLPPRSKRDVAILSGAGQSILLHAESASPGTALALPIDATAFTTGDWRELKQLSLRILDPQGDIKGVIPLDGVGPAIAKLSVACPSGGSK